MSNEYFQPGSVPAPNAPGSSAVIRSEFTNVAGAFDKLPVMAGHAGEIVAINGTGTGLVNSGILLGDFATLTGVQTLTNKTIAWASNTFPGFGSGATKDAGTGAGEVLLLDTNNQLPALDGSLLTGITTGIITGVVDIEHGGTGASDLGGAQTALGIDLKADANNAVLTGAPTAPTPATGDNSARIATTYFVTETVGAIGAFAPSNAAPLMNGVAASGVGVLGSRDDHVHPTDTSRAPIASPVFTGNPTAPTPSPGDDDLSIATTAFVNAEIAADRPYSDTNPLINGTATQGVSPRVSRQDHVHPTDTTRAPLASPTFTGDPKAPTPLTSDNDTSIATTAFVQSLVAQQPFGMLPSNNVPLMNGVAAAGLGVTGSRDDHVHPSDTSRLAVTGGSITANSASAALTITQTGAGNVLEVLDAAGDVTPFVIDANGTVIIGNQLNSANDNGNVTAKLSVADSTVTTVALASSGSATGRFASSVAMKRNRGPFTAPTIVVDGDYVGRVDFQGFDGSGFIDLGRIHAAVDGTPDLNNMPGRLVFSTSPTGSGSPVERMRIDSNGNVGIGKSPESRLDITATDNFITNYPLWIENAATNYGTGYGAYGMSNRNIGGTATNVPYTFDIGDAAIFKTNDVERMRIDSNGKVGIGGASGGQTLLVNSSNTFDPLNGPATAGIHVRGAGTWGLGAYGGSITLGQSNQSGRPGAGIASVQTTTDSDQCGLAIFVHGSTSSNEQLEQVGVIDHLGLATFKSLATEKVNVTSPAASDGNVFSGTYTPTQTPVANVTSSTAKSLQYLRGGNTITVSGQITVTPAAAGGALTTLRISLPVPSAFTLSTHLGGSGTATNVAAQTNGMGISADVTNDAAVVSFYSQTTSLLNFFFSFTYRVI